MLADVASTLHRHRQQIDRAVEIASLENQIQQNADAIEACTARRDLRRRNALRWQNEQLMSQIGRRKRKGWVLTAKLDEAEQQLLPSKRRRAAVQLSDPAADPAKPSAIEQYLTSMQHLVEDVLLVADGDKVQNARTRMDDVCTNCKIPMERNLTLSYLVCPECQAMRWYMDTSLAVSGGGRNPSGNHRVDVQTQAKCVTHFSSFISNSQGKTTKRFSKQYLHRIAYYCYCEGARKPTDITKKMVNKAQKYLGNTEYSISVILKTRLRGDCVRLPPPLVKKMQLLFKCMYPVFEQMKGELDSGRSNMINFCFVSRLLLRLLGYDVYLALFETFRMPRNAIKHSCFARKMFARLGWNFERLSEIPDAVLNAYEATQTLPAP